MYDIVPEGVQVETKKQGRDGVFYDHETEKERAIKNNTAIHNINKHK